jgi:hypothetical protein
MKWNASAPDAGVPSSLRRVEHAQIDLGALPSKALFSIPFSFSVERMNR